MDSALRDEIVKSGEAPRAAEAPLVLGAAVFYLAVVPWGTREDELQLLGQVLAGAVVRAAPRDCLVPPRRDFQKQI